MPENGMPVGKITSINPMPRVDKINVGDIVVWGDDQYRVTLNHDEYVRGGPHHRRIRLEDGTVLIMPSCMRLEVRHIQMIYFGCLAKPTSAGHFLHRPDLHHSSKETSLLMERLGIHPKIDGGFCPGADDRRRLGEVKQVEGHAKLTHHKDYTILAFWDRTGDGRGNSNSAFIEGGTHTFDEMVAKAKEVFPTIWARFKFEVKEIK